jgi:hypothetical protein
LNLHENASGLFLLRKLESDSNRILNSFQRFPVENA